MKHKDNSISGSVHSLGRLLTLLLLLALFATDGRGGEYDLTLQGAWTRPNSETFNYIAVEANHAYAASTNALKIFDVADPANVQLLGGYTFSSPNLITAVAVSGTNAFVIDLGSRLTVLNVSDPTKPQLSGTLKMSLYGHAIAVAGSLLYVVEDGPLKVVDASQPSNPKLVGSFVSTASAYGVAAAGKYAYLTTSDTALQVIDMSDPTQPLRVGSYSGSGGSAIAVLGNYACVLGRNLEVIDIRNPTNPLPVGSWSLPYYGRSVVMAGKYAYLGSGSIVLDLGDPRSPRRVYNNPLSSVGTALAAYGTRVYVAGNGLEILDLADSVTPLRVGGLELGYANEVAVQGDRVYLADGAAGLQILDITDRAHPKAMGVLKTGGTAVDIAVTNHFAYVADQGSGLQVIDVSDPNKPNKVGEFRTNGLALSVALSGTNAFVAYGGTGLMILDISNPATPRLVATVTNSASTTNFSSPFGSTYQVSVRGHYAYLANGTAGLQILDISDPAKPRHVGEYRIQRGFFFDNMLDVRKVKVTSAYAYVVPFVGGEGWVEGPMILSVSNPAQPVLTTGNMGIATLRGLANVGDYLFAVGNYRWYGFQSSLTVFGVANHPADPPVMSFYQLGDANGIVIEKQYAYVANGRSGMLVLRIPDSMLAPRVQLSALNLYQSGFTVTVRGPDGLAGRIERATTSGNWSTWISSTMSGNPLYFPDPDVTNSPARFYRFVSP